MHRVYSLGCLSLHRLLFPAQLEQLIEIHSNLLRDMRNAFHSGEDEIGRIFLQLLGSRQVCTRLSRATAPPVTVASNQQDLGSRAEPPCTPHAPCRLDLPVSMVHI